MKVTANDCITVADKEIDLFLEIDFQPEERARIHWDEHDHPGWPAEATLESARAEIGGKTFDLTAIADAAYSMDQLIQICVNETEDCYT